MPRQQSPALMTRMMPLLSISMSARWWLVCFFPYLMMAATSSRSSRTAASSWRANTEIQKYRIPKYLAADEVGLAAGRRLVGEAAAGAEQVDMAGEGGAEQRPEARRLVVCGEVVAVPAAGSCCR